MITSRNYAITSATGDVIGAASSVWAMIDLQSRKAVNIDEYYMKFATKRPPLCQKPRRIGDLRSAEIRKYSPLYSDIDTNVHVYSGKYIEWFMDLIPNPQKFFLQKKIKFVELNFVSESLFGDDLDLAVEKVTDDEFLFEAKRLEILICRMKAVFA